MKHNKAHGASGAQPDTQDAIRPIEVAGTVEFKPAMKELGTTKCPVCRRSVTVFMTKTHRPFLNCSFCSARIFYNGSESLRLLKARMKFNGEVQ